MDEVRFALIIAAICYFCIAYMGRFACRLDRISYLSFSSSRGYFFQVSFMATDAYRLSQPFTETIGLPPQASTFII